MPIPRFFSGFPAIIGLLVFTTAGLAPAARAQFESYRASGYDVDTVESSTSATTGNVAGSATATAGLLSFSVSGARTSLPGGDNAGNYGGSGAAAYTNTRFLLDPEWVGQLGYVHVTGSIGVSAAGSSVTNEFGFTVQNYANARAELSYGSTYLSPEPTGYVSSNESVGSQQAIDLNAPILAGRAFSLGISGSANASVNYYGMGGSSNATATGSVQFELFLTEERLHWTSADTVLQAGSTAQWAESLALNDGRYAVFNDEAARTLSLSLNQSQEWRGLVVDGETLALNLAGHTLTLGSAGDSVKDYNLRIGEGRGGTSQLTLSNGTVILDHDMLVGREAATPGTLIFENAASIREHEDSISALIGVDGAGVLGVRGGSTLSVSQVILGVHASGQGMATVEGTGSKLTTVGLFVGQLGEGALTVSSGAGIQTNRLGVAGGANSIGTMTVEGAGTRLDLIAVTNSSAYVGTGQGSRGTLEIKDGAALNADSIVIEVGSGRVADAAAFRVTGTGTTLTDVGINVHAGGSFQLSDGATWNDGGLIITGGEARIQANATATLGNRVQVGGVIENGNVVKTGQLTVGYGGTLTASGEFNINQGGALVVTGAGALVNGFSSLFVDGRLDVGSGGRVEAATTSFGLGDVFLRSGATLLGRGAINANVTLAEGTLLRPGNSPGTLTIEGNLTLAEGARLQLELAGIARGVSYDRLIVTGNASFAAGSVVEFAFIDGFAPVTGQTFSFFDVAGGFNYATGSVLLDVSGLEAGWLYDTGMVDGVFTLTSLSNGVAVSAVPEPSTWAVIVGSVALVVAGLRRRRKRSASAGSGFVLS
jgi:T5SS/PEP-CTERM-associated repeat protein/adhesin HecA-like repeat protein